MLRRIYPKFEAHARRKKKESSVPVYRSFFFFFWAGLQTSRPCFFTTMLLSPRSLGTIAFLYIIIYIEQHSFQHILLHPENSS